MKKPTAALVTVLITATMGFMGSTAALGLPAQPADTPPTGSETVAPGQDQTIDSEPGRSEVEEPTDGATVPGEPGDETTEPAPTETPARDPEPTPVPEQTPAPEDPAPTTEEQAPSDVELNPEADADQLFQRSFAAPTQLGSSRVSQRLSGDDRFTTAISLSKYAYPSGADTVFLSTGMDYPDSLSAAPVAAVKKAPLLLSHSSTLTGSTAAELRRLKPKTIVLVGGTGVLGKEVESAAKKIAPRVVRVGGADRYETSLALARYGWAKSAGAFIATGTGYADALSAGSAAGSLRQPVVLVPGLAPSASPNTNKTLKDLGVTQLTIAGGTGVVSSSMEGHLKQGNQRKVTRYGGIDRFATSALLVNGLFPNAPKAFLAPGMNFPDALAGAAVAGSQASPLLLVQQTCIPTQIYDAHDRVKPQQTFVVGGAGVLTAGVLHGNECAAAKPSFIDSASWNGVSAAYTESNALRYSAGVSGARLKENVGNYPAFRWSKTMSTSGYKHNPNVYKEVPWAQGENIAWSTGWGTPAASGRAIVGFWRDSPAHYRNVTAVVAGKRTVFSVGFFRGNTGKDFATLIVGY